MTCLLRCKITHSPINIMQLRVKRAKCALKGLNLSAAHLFYICYSSFFVVGQKCHVLDDPTISLPPLLGFSFSHIKIGKQPLTTVIVE